MIMCVMYCKYNLYVLYQRSLQAFSASYDAAFEAFNEAIRALDRHRYDPLAFRRRQRYILIFIKPPKLCHTLINLL